MGALALRGEKTPINACVLSGLVILVAHATAPVKMEIPVYTLERLPRRCPVAPESKKAKRRLRHLLYGAKPDVYRLIYEIDELRKAVRVLTIRHAAMDEFISGA